MWPTLRELWQSANDVCLDDCSARCEEVQLRVDGRICATKPLPTPARSFLMHHWSWFQGGRTSSFPKAQFIAPAGRKTHVATWRTPWAPAQSASLQSAAISFSPWTLLQLPFTYWSYRHRCGWIGCYHLHRRSVRSMRWHSALASLSSVKLCRW